MAISAYKEYRISMLDKTVLRFIILSILFGGFLTGLFFTGSKIINSTANNLAPTQISKTVSQLTVSDDGDYAYIDGATLHIRLKESDEILIENFNSTDTRLSRDGSFIAFKNGSSCEIKSLPNLELIRTETCLTEIFWTSNSGYLFFEGLQDRGSDFFDDDLAVLTFGDALSNNKKAIGDVSANSLIIVAWGDPTFVSIGSVVEDVSRVCELKTDEDNIFQNCTEVDASITALKEFDGRAYASARQDLSEVNMEINNGSIQKLNSSISLTKAGKTSFGMFVFDESSPTKTTSLNIVDGEEKMPKIEIVLKRFHGVKETHSLGPDNYLIYANNGLWELRL